jgi:3'-phosphoadenosine 5'-phosphosulfate sulfotransferase (PAPS reductase)/FAD synthetase
VCVIDPFLIQGPTLLQLSGGRTSAFLLWCMLRANGGLPADTLVSFENTGKEDEKTLRFVDRIAREWAVPVVWLEYRMGPTFEVVDFASASRAGEPFESVIAQRGHILPNIRSAYCSSELKTRTAHRYLRSMGWTEWDTMLGIRADEPARVARFRANPSPETPAEEIFLPLAAAGITKGAVGAFWGSHSFDLELQSVNGITPEGNCDLCFKKPAARVQSLIAHRPSRAVWWAAQERGAEAYAAGDGARFRNDRPSYERMARFAADQIDVFNPNEEAIDCFCGD